MLTRIAAFEVRYQLRSPLFFVGFALFFLLTFGSVTIDQIQIGGKGNVNVNSPFAILQTTSIMTVFGVFIVTAFVANVVIRDDETGFAPILRTTRIKKFDYLLGRFAGAIMVGFVITASVPLAILVGSWMPWLDAEKLGPFVAGHYLYALFVFGLPTLLLTGAAFFALATAMRSMMWTYLGTMAFFVLFAVSRVLLRDPVHDTFSALSDPFGIGALMQTTKYWTASERNTQLPPLAGLILYNRLIWLSVAALLVALAYWTFRFETKGKRAVPGRILETPSGQPGPGLKPLAHAQTGRGAAWQQFLSLTRFDLRFVFKSPAFIVLLAIGIFNSLGSLVGTVEFRGTNYFPVTRAMVNALQGAYTLFPIIIAIYYAGELVWREREVGMHEIVGASAAPDWAFLVPKILAITLVLLATFVVGAAAAALFQLYHGYVRFQPAAYFLWFILPGLIAAVELAALSVFVQTLVPHKFMGWAVMLVYLVASITLNTIGFEHNLYNYGGEPGAPLSDMNGLGRFWIGRAWFQVYWLACALVLLVASHLLWRRGALAGQARRGARVAPGRGRSAMGRHGRVYLLQHQYPQRIPHPAGEREISGRLRKDSAAVRDRAPAADYGR